MLIEADGATVAVGHDDLVVAIGQTDAHHLVAFQDIDGIDTIGSRTAVGLETGLLDDTVLGGENHEVGVEELRIVEVLDAQYGIDGIIGLDVEQVLDGTSLGVLGSLGNLVALEPVAAALLGEEEQRVVHRGGIDILGEVGIAGLGSLAAHTATALLAELAQGGTLHIAHVTDGDDHGVIGIEVFGIELLAGVLDLRAALVAVFLLHLEQFVLHHLLAEFGVVENLLQIVDELHQLVILVVQLVHLQTRELAQTHVDDGAGLDFIEVEALHEVLDGLLGGLRRADEVYHLVDVVASHDEGFEDMGAVLGLLQVVTGAADGHVMTVVDKMAHAVLEREQFRTAMHQGDAVHREGALQGRHLEEFVEDDIGVGITAHIHHDTHTLTSRLIVDIGDALNLLLGGQVGNILHQVGLVHTVGNLGHHNLVMGVARLDFGLGTHHDASPTRLVGISHTLYTIYICAGGEIGSLDVLHQSVGIDVGVVDIGAAAVDHLTEVVRGDIGGHTHGDTVAAIHEQVGNLRGHYAGFLQRVVKVVHHVDGVLLQVVHDMLTHLGQTALGVTHGCGRVAVDGTEVTLTVDQGVAHRPVLGHTHQGSIYGTVAMGVVLTEHLTHDAGTFLIGVGTGVANAQHTVEDTTVDGLEAVSYIREGTCNNHRHGVVDVRGLHFFLDVDLDNSVLIDCLVHYC